MRFSFDSIAVTLYSVQPMNTPPNQRSADKQSQLTLELLQAIEQKDDISQRDLAQGMGVALGLANSYLKRCVKKGWVKITTAPANRYFYYLTPTGFAEKARLTADFFSASLALFRQSGNVYSEVFKTCLQRKQQRVILVGLSDLTEIALMRSMSSGLQVVAVFQPGSKRDEFFGVPVVGELTNSIEFDCAVLTSMEQTSELVVLLEGTLDEEQIIVPSLLLNMNYRCNEHLNDDDDGNEKSTTAMN